MLYYIGNTESFEKLTAQPIMTICMFTASWCKPCSIIKPKVIEYSETKTNVNFAFVDVDSFKSLADTYFINSVPTFLVFKEGQYIKRFQVPNVDQIKVLFDKIIN